MFFQMAWSRIKIHGFHPSPRAGCCGVLCGTKWYITGGGSKKKRMLFKGGSFFRNIRAYYLFISCELKLLHFSFRKKSNFCMKFTDLVLGYYIAFELFLLPFIQSSASVNHYNAFDWIAFVSTPCIFCVWNFHLINVPW